MRPEYPERPDDRVLAAPEVLIAEIFSVLAGEMVARKQVPHVSSMQPCDDQLLAAEYWSGTFDAANEAGKPGLETAGNATAQEQYQLGNFFYNRRGEGDLELAEKYYRAALDADPRLAAAWAGLSAVAMVRLATEEISWDAGLAEMEKAVQMALALDADLPEAQLRACRYHAAIGETDIADTHCRRALELAPDDPLMLAVAAGQFREAEAEVVRAMELGPTDRVQLEEELAFLQLHLGEFDSALAVFESLPPGFDRDRGLAMALHALDRRADADAALARLAEQADWRRAVYLAEVHAWRGEHRLAVDRLAQFTKMYTTRHCWLCIREITYVKLSLFFEPVRQHPEWKAAVADLS